MIKYSYQLRGPVILVLMEGNKEELELEINSIHNKSPILFDTSDDGEKHFYISPPKFKWYANDQGVLFWIKPEVLLGIFQQSELYKIINKLDSYFHRYTDINKEITDISPSLVNKANGLGQARFNAMEQRTDLFLYFGPIDEEYYFDIKEANRAVQQED